MTKSMTARSLVALLALTGLSSANAAHAEPAAVEALYESEPFLESDDDADADDPAIWVHPRERAESLVIGTLKNAGLVVLDLKGRTLQRIAAPAAPGPDDEAGRFNNVDLVLGFRLRGVPTDLAVVSDRGRDKLVVYKIDPRWKKTGKPLVDVTAASAPWVFSKTQAEVNEQNTAYGLATTSLPRRGGDEAFGFVTQRERARLAKVRFNETRDGKVTYAVSQYLAFPSSFKLPNGRSWTPCADEDGVEPQFEGLVIDSRGLALYAAQETVGIWRVSLDGNRRSLIERVRSYGVDYTRVYDEEEEEFACTYGSDPGYGGKHLTADAEGLTIYEVPGAGDDRYLSASGQGDDVFSVWDIDDGKWNYEGSYTIALGDDENQQSDGAHVVSTDLGPDYPFGLLVTQDGENTPEALDDDGEPVANTNFKFTPFDRVIEALDL